MTISAIGVDIASMERSVGTLDAHTGKLTDPFRAEAAKIFMVPESQVTDLQRKYAKQMTYRQLYSKETYAR